MNKLENTMFSMSLYYDDLPTKFEQQNTQYNGNIAAIEWNTPIDENTTKLQGYEFEYDVLNRLTKADYRDFTNTTSGAYSTSYSYDKNGNIKTLRRYGHDMLIDNLNYIYDGNQLLEVLDLEDGGSTPLPDKSGSSLTLGFNPIASGHYTYDYNGNLETNPAKGINEIDYNKLNLPTEVETINGSINYLYSASGEKLRKFVGSENHYYIGMFEFDHEHKFVFAHTEEGRIRIVDGKTIFDYALKDHLGNTRVMFTVTDNNDIELMESNHYYPFGMRFNQASAVNTGSDNKYLYNGKELQEDFGLNWYDYGARFYDPSIGRWSAVDPMAESYLSYSPYNYTMNNPIKFIDPNGMNAHDAISFQWDQEEAQREAEMNAIMDAEIENKAAKPDTYTVNRDNGAISKVDKTKYYKTSSGEIKTLGEDESTDGKQLLDKITNDKGQSLFFTAGRLKESGSDNSFTTAFENVKEGKSFYMFLARSSKVEWAAGIAKMVDGSSKCFIGTDGLEGQNSFIDKLGDAYGNNLTWASHSHYTGGAPSYNLRDKNRNLVGDLNAAESRGLNTQYEVYDVANRKIWGYKQYTINRAPGPGSVSRPAIYDYKLKVRN